MLSSLLLLPYLLLHILHPSPSSPSQRNSLSSLLLRYPLLLPQALPVRETLYPPYFSVTPSYFPKLFQSEKLSILPTSPLPPPTSPSSSSQRNSLSSLLLRYPLLLPQALPVRETLYPPYFSSFTSSYFPKLLQSEKSCEPAPAQQRTIEQQIFPETKVQLLSV